MRSFEDGINYEKIGYFLVSEKKILGPRFYFEPDESKLAKILRKLILDKKYREIEELLGIRLGRERVEFLKNKKEIYNDGYEIKSFKDTYVNRQRGYSIDLELYDTWKRYTPTSTLATSTYEKVDDLTIINYYEKNLHLMTGIGRIPPEFVEGVVNGNLYKTFFEKLGFDQEKMYVDMVHETWNDRVIINVEGTYDKTTVHTILRLDLRKNQDELRFIAWPFEEGVYAFTMDPRRPVPVTVRSIKDIRKKVNNVSKIFGVPHGVKIPDDWTIAYDHTYRRLSYQSLDGKTEVIFMRDSDYVFLKHNDTMRKVDRGTARLILEMFFGNPEMIMLL